MSSVVSFAMYFDAIVTLVKVGEMENQFWLSLSWCTSFSALLEKGGRGKWGNAPSGTEQLS